MEKFVIDLGGSLIYPKRLNFPFLVKFSSFIKREIKKGKKFIIVSGGGELARIYQRALDKIGRFSKKEKDILGILATKLNAYFLKILFRKYAYPQILDKEKKIKSFKNFSVILASGLKPGASTDLVSLKLAKDFKVKNIIFLTNVSYIYDKDPKRYRKVKPFKRLTFKDYRTLFNSSWRPGMKIPIDPLAVKFAQKEKLKIILALGKDLKNLKKILDKRDFKGTFVLPSKLIDLRKEKIEKISKEVILALKKGKVVLAPTDTIYGLLANGLNKQAVEKVFQIKKRDFKKPVPFFVKDLKMAKKFAQIDRKREKILKRYWPGKYTFVFKRKKKKIFGASPSTIGLRIPNHLLIKKILEKVDFPIVGTSANISGLFGSFKINEVLSQLEILPELIIDQGNLKPSKPSKVIDLTSSRAKILRA